MTRLQRQRKKMNSGHSGEASERRHQRGHDGDWGDTTMGKGSSVGKLIATTPLAQASSCTGWLSMDVGRGLVQLTSMLFPNLVAVTYTWD